MHKPRTLVWGACGFIGSHLVSRLLELGLEVRVLTWDRRRYRVPDWAGSVEWLELSGSPADSRILAEAVGSSDVIYNLAGSSGAVASNRDPMHSLETICRPQLEFLRACEVHGSQPRAVFASSRLVYGHPAQIPVAEEAPLCPQSMYAVHKLCVENYHRIYAQRGALSFAICRISNPYGMDKAGRAKEYGFINRLIHQALDGLPLTIYGDGGQLRDYLHIDDVADALILAGFREEARNQVFNIGQGVGISLRDAASEIQRAAQAGTLRFSAWPLEDYRVESGDFVADIQKAKRLLNFEPKYDFTSGLKQTVEEERRFRRQSDVGAQREPTTERKRSILTLPSRKVEGNESKPHELWA